MLKIISEADNNDYLISDKGQVIHNGLQLKYRMTKNGYARVNVLIGGKYVDRYVHRLVAQYFIPNPNNYPCVNHIDGDKTNNEVSNLEWCSYKMNMEYASKHGLVNHNSQKRKDQCKLNQKKSVKALSLPMVEYDENGSYIKEHLSGSQALYRISYKGHYYRDKKTLINLYGKVPQFLVNFEDYKKARSHNRKIYTSVNLDTHEVRCYDKLADLPITREQFYFAYNHSIPDKNGWEWSVTIL